MAYIGTSPSNGVRRRFVYEATASQTSFSGSDENGVTLTYVDSLYLDVYQNGIKLKAGDDYTATTGTSVVLVQGASANDVVEMVAFDVFSVGDTVSAKDGGSFAGNVTMAGTLGVTGAVTANAGVVVDEITLDGDTLTATDDFIIDAAGDITLDADGGDIFFKDAGTTIAEFTNNDSDFELKVAVQDKDIRFRGNDGGVAINALKLDMSDGGAATLNNGLTLTDGNLVVANGHGIDFSATANISGKSSELLDDYEKGTWTASLYGSTSGTGTNTTATGNYVKVGQVCTVGVYLPSMNLSSMSGSTLIGGLPFTCGGGLNTGSLTLYGFTFTGFVTPYVNNSTTVVDILNMVSNGAWTGLAIPAAAGKYVMLGITYQTA